jgi:23S rRNA (guanosine2251-2'-O)-methyltransferase
MSITVHNPHSVLAAIQTRPQDVLELVIPSSTARDDAWARVAEAARLKRIQIKSSGSSSGGSSGSSGGPKNSPRRGGESDGRSSAAHGTLKERAGISAEEIFSDARERAGGNGLWLALDSLQDPHNVGAIFRAAAFFGVEGIMLTEERSAPLTGTVYDVACGGVEYVPFVLQTNLQRGFEIAKDAGLWILGTSEHAKDNLSSVAKDRPWLLVLGNEEKGMRRLTEESCDLLCKIPPAGRVTSLNVSVAAGILISSLSPSK